MGWAIGYDPTHQRDVGYGVPAWCDHPQCSNEIDRGLAYICGGDIGGGERGCGLFFCEEHREGSPQLCSRCRHRKKSFRPGKDHPKWLLWKLSDPS